jgi:uncharacterized protein with NRDE domain
MCLIIFSWRTSTRYPLILAGNRDEFLDRPTRAAHHWENLQHIFGGRDLKDGGGWLALSTQGAFAAVTNVREPGQRADARSRGQIVRDFLHQPQSAMSFALALQEEQDAYNGFNALLCDGAHLVYLSNRNEQNPRLLAPGHYGLSNHALETPWPKVVRARNTLSGIAHLHDPELLSAHLIDALQHDTPAPDESLPDTGFGLALERQLSPVFIRGEVYGTRATSVLLQDAAGAMHFTERSYQPDAFTHLFLKPT